MDFFLVTIGYKLVTTWMLLVLFGIGLALKLAYVVDNAIELGNDEMVSWQTLTLLF